MRYRYWLKREGRSKLGKGVLVSEAMKLEMDIQRNIAGVVVMVSLGKVDRVTPGEVLVDIVAS